MPSPTASSTAPPASARTGRTWLAGLALVLAALLAYAPSLPGEFLWDDDSYVTGNMVLRDPGGLADVWVPRRTPQYYPIVFSVLWAEYQLWGDDPLGYHLVNLVLHALNGLLVWAVFRQLRVRGALWIGAAFALHPLHVETVAWAMELKNVLSATFYLTAAFAHLKFDALRASSGRTRWAWWAAGLFAFVLALLSKSVTCTLPAALILALVFRGGRLVPSRWMALLPHFAVGAALGIFTAQLEAEFVGAQGAEFAFTFAERCLIATRALLFYPAQLLVPHTLLFNYPRWSIDPSDWTAWWSVGLVLLVFGALLVVALRGRRGPLLAGLFYAGTISPALGFVNFYPMRFSFVADHFCYLASLGVLAGVVAALSRLGARAAKFAPLAWVAVLFALTLGHGHTFGSAERLYRDTLEHHPDSWLCHGALGTLLLDRATLRHQSGDFAGAAPGLLEARGHFEASIALHDTHYEDHFNLALTLDRLGEPLLAVEPALRAAELKPELARCRSLAGSLLLRAGRTSEATEHLVAALDLEPQNPYHLETLGQVYEDSGQDSRARDYFQSAYERGIDLPGRLRPGAQLALLLATSRDDSVRDPSAALQLADELAAMTPQTVPQVEQARAEALYALGRLDEARALADKLLALTRRTGVAELIEDAEARRARFDVARE